MEPAEITRGNHHEDVFRANFPLARDHRQSGRRRPISSPGQVLGPDAGSGCDARDQEILEQEGCPSFAQIPMAAFARHQELKGRVTRVPPTGTKFYRKIFQDSLLSRWADVGWDLLHEECQSQKPVKEPASSNVTKPIAPSRWKLERHPWGLSMEDDL
ncbi:hypothetical protein SELMODRAFT_403335 [Selaginella moellendorffii]|uniref:Uncharacterized protein n=1 Tax=Selaginella moellendorffii TaxID=88036 RepID=D8QTU4_SELML|nr:hypothetical protein SELMODRAFT_403335 [Selaginella moellendorffii]